MRKRTITGHGGVEHEHAQEHEKSQWGRVKRPKGMALLVVVVLVMFVSLAAYRYSFEMENEYRLTRLQEEQVQARLCAQSGI
ncbi:MAG: hypothetical protein ACKO8U_01240, partial [Pirellula sp.]